MHFHPNTCIGMMLQVLFERIGSKCLFNSQKSVKCVEDISAGKPVREEDLITLCQLPDALSTTCQFYTTLRAYLLQMQSYSVLPLITMKAKTRDKRSLDELFSICRDANTAEVRMCI